MDTLYVLKVKCRGVLRRISSRRDPPAFDHVDGQIRKLFKIPADKPITVTYTDSDGDVITVSTDEDLHDAFIYQELNPLRLDVAVESDDFVDVCSLDGSVYSSSSFGGDAAPSAPSVPSAPSAPSAVAPAAVNSTPAPAASDSAADSAAQTVPVPPAPAVDEPPPAPASAPAPTPAPAPTQPDSAAPDASASTSEPAPAAADAAPAASEPAPAAASSSAQSSKPSVPEDLDEAFEAKVAEFATAVENQILKALASGGQLERMLAQYGPILKDAPGKIAQVLATARRSGLDVVFEPILEMHQRRQQQDQQYGGSSGGCGSSKPSTSSAADSAAAAAAADSAAAAADIAAAVSADVAAATSAVAAAIAAAADALGPNPEVAAPAPTPTPAPAAAAAAATAPAAAAAASASDSASESAEAVHYGITCDGCDMRPLKGKRYRSLVKHDFDLCEACYSKEGSISEHYECIVNPPAAKVYFPVKPAGAACSAGTASGTASACPATAASASAAGSQGSAAEKAGEAAKVVHYGIICDGCDKRPIQGKRYRSLVKDDYDLCEACYSKAGVVAEHYECIDRPLFRPSRLQHMAAHAAAMAGMPEGGRPFFAPRPHCPFSHHSMPHSWGPGNKHHHHQHPHQHPPHHHHPNSTAFTSSSSVGGSVGGTVGQLQYGRVHGRLLDARYVRDVNVHDGTEMAPLTRFTKIWRLRNSGSVPWPCDLQVIHAGGDLLSETSTVPLELPRGGVYPEQEVDVAVDMAAPARPGRYMSHWRLLAPGGPKFGHRFWAQIQVVEPSAMEEEPAPLLAAAPAAAPAAASAPPAPLVPAAVAAESESPSLPEVVSVKASPSTDAAADAAPVEDAAAGAAAVDQAGAEEAVEESGAVSVVQVAEEKEEAGSVQAEEEEKLEVAVQSNEVVEEEQAEEVKEEVKAEEEKQEEEQEWEDPIITAIRNAADNIGSTAAGAAAAAESDVGAAMAAVGDVVIDVAPASAEPAAPASTAVIAAAASAEEWTDLRASSPADDTASTISTTTDATTSETIPSVLTASDVSSTLLPPLASSSSNAASDASSSVSTPRAEDTAVGSFSLVNVSYPSIASIACVAPVPAAPAPGQSLYPSVESIGVLVQEAAAAAEAAAGAAAGAVAAAGGAVTEDLLTGDDYVNVSQEVPTAPVLVPAAVPAPAAMPSPASFLDEEEEIEMETPPLIVNSSAPAAATPSTPAATSEAPGAPAEAPAAAPVSPAPSAVAAPGAVAYGGRYDSQVQQLLEMGFPYPALNGELLEFTSGNMDEVVTMLVKVTTEWQEKMDELEDMDFTDKEMNMRLLLKHDGSYKRTVRELVALDKASRKAGRADRA